MQEFQRAFVQFMLSSGVLGFGEFLTKSGRVSPYFINAGSYRTGAQMNQLASYYADAIQERGIAFDFLFGPAYKGIPLVVSVSMELARRGHDASFCFNRKEAKDHGEGGLLVGHTPRSGERALIVEDVTTAGTSIRETVPLLRASADVELAGLVVSVDRMEQGHTGKSALVELSDEFSLDAFSIVTIEEIMNALRNGEVTADAKIDDDLFRRYDEYRARYGARGDSAAAAASVLGGNENNARRSN